MELNSFKLNFATEAMQCFIDIYLVKRNNKFQLRPISYQSKLEYSIYIRWVSASFLKNLYKYHCYDGANIRD